MNNPEFEKARILDHYGTYKTSMIRNWVATEELKASILNFIKITTASPNLSPGTKRSNPRLRRRLLCMNFRDEALDHHWTARCVVSVIKEQN
jgi:hypothetical protein